MAGYYDRSIKWLLNHIMLGLGVFAVLVAATILIFSVIPTAFLPDEDQGRLIAIIEGPANATFERMSGIVGRVENYFLKEMKGVTQGIFTVRGTNVSGRGQNTAGAYVNLMAYEERKGEASVFSVTENGMKAFANDPDGKVTMITPPAIQEMGNAKGFEFQLIDQGGVGREKLIEGRDLLLSTLQSDPTIGFVRLNSLPDVPQYKVDIDYQKAKSLGLAAENINSTMNTAWGSVYVNNFIENNRVKRVFVQGDTPYRMNPENLQKWFVRNQTGQMVSFVDFASGKWIYGPPQLQRYNGFPAFEIQGEAARGRSTGEAMKAVMEVQKKLPKGLSVEWTGLSYEERQSESQIYILYLISILAIFLCLAALYESWSVPFAIMLVLPLGIFGSTLMVWGMDLRNDIYFKVGFLLSLGLAAKNAILIVEFAEIQISRGKSAIEATLEACRQRFRPILMTSFTFILGILPLVVATGPGAGSQNSIGSTLMGGILASTFLIIFFAPVFFVGILKMKARFTRRSEL
jgi:multidrug efflux pump